MSVLYYYTLKNNETLTIFSELTLDGCTLDHWSVYKLFKFNEEAIELDSVYSFQMKNKVCFKSVV